MGELLLTALGLGIAGIDPAGALIAIGALAAGARRRTVLAFTAVVLAGTALLGLVLSLVVGPRLGDLDLSFLVPQGDGGALLELLAAAALLVWAARRARRHQGRPPRPKRRRSAGWAPLLGLGLLFAASAALDPTFVGLVVIAGRDGAALQILAAHVLWVAVSQAPLVLVAVAVATNRHERLVAGAQRRWARVAPTAARLLTVVLVLAAAVLAADALTQLLTGQFLIAPGAG